MALFIGDSGQSLGVNVSPSHQEITGSWLCPGPREPNQSILSSLGASRSMRLVSAF